jgi:RNA polymerase sigma factor (sigma-70 family)
VGIGDGRQERFEEAFRRLLPRAVTVGYRVLGDRAEAEDAAVEALARASASWPRVGRLTYRDAWVLRVTANVATDMARRRRATSPAVEVPTEGAEDGVVARLALADALRSLSRRQRDVVLLRYFADLTEAEVARTLRMSVGSVKKHTSRAVASLRRSLGDGWEEARVVAR